MAQFILTNSKVYADLYDVSGYLNQGEIQKASDMHDVTPFGALEHRSAPGLQGGNWSLNGFTEYGTTPPKIEKIISLLQGSRDKPLTIVPEGPTVGNVSVFLPAAFHGMDRGAPHGNPDTFAWRGGTSKWQPIGGFLDEPGAVARTATGQTTGQNLGAVSATQYLYAAVHVFAGGTGTMDLVVESDSSAPFSTPVTAITFPQFSGVSGGSGIMRAIGTFSGDTFFRFKYTLAATPSVTFVASFGIAS
jgi:hypothetical protein